MVFYFSLLVDEINAYDAKTKQQAENVTENSSNVSKVKDYKKTSLLKAVNIMEEFLRGLESARKRKLGEDMEM